MLAPFELQITAAREEINNIFIPVNDVLNHSATFYFGINGFRGGRGTESINSAANFCAQFFPEEKRLHLGLCISRERSPTQGLRARKWANTCRLGKLLGSGGLATSFTQ